MRGRKHNDTPILPGYQIYHNFIREHEALGNKTSGEACGIKINGENKWKTLIENASVNKAGNREAMREIGGFSCLTITGFPKSILWR